MKSITLRNTSQPSRVRPLRNHVKKLREKERVRGGSRRTVHSGALLELPYGQATMRRDASSLFEGVQEARSRYKSHEYGIPWPPEDSPGRATRTHPKYECTCIEQYIFYIAHFSPLFPAYERDEARGRFSLSLGGMIGFVILVVVTRLLCAPNMHVE